MSMIGKTLGHYQITSQLGKGGMGEVYQASDQKLDREVAIKVLPEEFAKDTDRVARFQREAKLLASLNHPNIADIHGLEESGGTSFLVLELVEGQTLEDRIKAGTIPVEECLKLALQIGEALEAAHEKGVIHRDLKPRNIMVTEKGLVKVLDFGLAKLMESAEGGESAATLTIPPATEQGTIIGTAPYMSPEQAQGKAVDARSDIFSFGSVFYEMLTGKRAFQGDSTISVMSSILRDHPVPAKKIRPDVPREVERLLQRCLEKDREARYPSGTELVRDLQALESHLYVAMGDFRRLIRRPSVAVPLIIALLGLSYAGFLIYRHNAKVRWARELALPEIERLVTEGKRFAAFDLAKKAEAYIPGDPALKRLWPTLSAEISVTTNPPGAEVFMKDYTTPDSPWRSVGRSPLEKFVIPAGLLRWKVEKNGYAALEICSNSGWYKSLDLSLEREGQAPSRMVRVDGTASEVIDWGLLMPGLDYVKSGPLGYYWMDKYEVTNRQFQEFVEKGGYQKREYWKNLFEENGRTLSWNEAMVRFHDTTGRPGPATWELGTYPRGQEDYPVSGVSWYEAAAYAEYAGKSLPSLFHWVFAAGTPLGEYIIPLSNVGSRGPARVGSHHGMNFWGTYDMAGNVKEWCWNAANPDKRYILGGAYNEPAYMFNTPDARPPLDRSPELGFRCVKYLSPPPDIVTASVSSPSRNYDKETPIPDRVFETYKSFYSYDKTPLNASTPSVVDDEEDWRKEKVSFDAAYGKDRITAYLFLPKKSRPPYQTVVFFPGSSVITKSSSEHLDDLQRFDFIVRSGRALMYPIYRGTYERRDDLSSDWPNTTNSYRDHVICWSKDLGRSIDYLETRPEIDRKKIAFYGNSWGAALGAILPAVESRFKAGVLIAGGFYQQRALPEVDQINFAPRVKIPIFMLNGRYDCFVPVETSQDPMFRFLGTARDDKDRKLCESGHAPPLREIYKETLAWLERYLGSVPTR